MNKDYRSFVPPRNGACPGHTFFLIMGMRVVL